MDQEPLQAGLGLAVAFLFAGIHMALAVARALGIIGRRYH